VAAAEAVGEVEAKEVVEAMPKEVVEAMPKEVAGSAAAVREVVGADSVADSHLESRRGARNAAMPTWGRSVAALAEVALGRVQAPEARDERAAALAAQVGQVLERAARDAKQPELVMQEDRVQSPVAQVSGRQILAA
jgi:hypothetical protein